MVVLSADGSTIGFISTADLTGQNGSNGFRLFLARTSASSEVDQIGNSENYSNLLGFANSNPLIVTADIGLVSIVGLRHTVAARIRCEITNELTHAR
jgi:hypothetical protein